MKILKRKRQGNTYFYYQWSLKSFDGRSFNEPRIFDVNRSMAKSGGREPKGLSDGDDNVLVKVYSLKASLLFYGLPSLSSSDVWLPPKGVFLLRQG